MDNTFNIVSICSGVGMLDLGFELACQHHEIKARALCYVEREASAAARLLARMEDQSMEPAPIWCGGDLAAIPLADIANLGRVDCVLGGIPCQPFSVAGDQQGVDDERWLWPLMRDLAGCLGARWIGIENVSGFVHAGLDPILHDFAESGWNAEWLHLRASDVGASHRRERIFLLANTKSERNRRPAEAARRERHADIDRRGADVGDASGIGGKMRAFVHGQHDGKGFKQGCHDVGATLEHADSPRRTTTLTRSVQHSGRESKQGSCDLADACCKRRQGGEWGGSHDKQGSPSHGSTGQCCDLPVFAPGPTAPEWGDIIAQYPHLAPATEPGLHCMADGVALVVDADRSDAFRAIGNGVVPLQAAVAFTKLFRRLTPNE